MNVGARPTKAKLAQEESATADLIMSLTRREIGPAMAADLVDHNPRDVIQRMIALFDWYSEKAQAKGPGFLVDSIRNPKKYRLPREFVKSQSTSKLPERVVKTHRDQLVATPATNSLTVQSRVQAFKKFWQTSGPDRRIEFEEAALQSATALKRDGYRRSREKGGPAFEEYRQMILRDHFDSYNLEPGSKRGT